jgi:coenzyme F420-reducing hydrogenase alpha subunit
MPRRSKRRVRSVSIETTDEGRRTKDERPRTKENHPSPTKTRTINVGYLARVEGEGGLCVKIKGGQVTEARLEIFEPPRFFEALLRGREFTEAPDITARICGICPVAYQMSSVHAMENAYGVTVGGQLRDLRRLLYCGEWIESHALHVYMLHAPDFLGYSDAIKMAADYPDIVKRGLTLKKIGNEIMSLLGGREIHPINVRVGGFYRVPHTGELLELEERLVWARQASLDTVRWVSTLDFPRMERDYEFVALRHENEYAMNEGRLVSNKGLNLPISDYEQHFHEIHVPYSNALQSTLHDHSYFVGPMARYNLNYDKLPAIAREAAREAGLGPTCFNPFKSIIIRSVELLYACEEALRIIEKYTIPDHPYVEVGSGRRTKDEERRTKDEERRTSAQLVVRDGTEYAKEHIGEVARTGYGCSEAPRGILYHRYDLDENDLILDAKIVPPTSQNQKAMEEDLRAFVSERIDLPKEQLEWQCEQAVRNYDPCISCATHFLRFEVERS